MLWGHVHNRQVNLCSLHQQLQSNPHVNRLRTQKSLYPSQGFKTVFQLARVTLQSLFGESHFPTGVWQSRALALRDTHASPSGQHSSPRTLRRSLPCSFTSHPGGGGSGDVGGHPAMIYPEWRARERSEEQPVVVSTRQGVGETRRQTGSPGRTEGDRTRGRARGRGYEGKGSGHNAATRK